MSAGLGEQRPVAKAPDTTLLRTEGKVGADDLLRPIGGGDEDVIGMAQDTNDEPEAVSNARCVGDLRRSPVGGTVPGIDKA